MSANVASRARIVVARRRCSTAEAEHPRRAGGRPLAGRGSVSSRLSTSNQLLLNGEQIESCVCQSAQSALQSRRHRTTAAAAAAGEDSHHSDDDDDKTSLQNDAPS